jgi:type I restriction enzyme M protein
MEQLRHRLTDVSRNGQTCRVDQNTLKRSDLDDFVSCYFGGTSAVSSKAGTEASPPGKSRHDRKESERFKSFTYEELTKRDKVNLDIFWLKDESLEDSANLPDPGVLALEITEDLEAAIAQFAEIAADLKTVS